MIALTTPIFVGCVFAELNSRISNESKRSQVVVV